MTQYSSPKWCWFYYSFFGIIITVFACLLSPDAEKDTQIEEQGESDVSTSQEDYVSQRRLALEL